MEMPREGDYIAIQSYKHNGTLHRNWRDTMVVKTEQNIIIGVNDRTLITEEDGRKWISREPAIVYFHRKLWFNVIAMLRPDGVAYYANLANNNCSTIVLVHGDSNKIDFKKELEERIAKMGKTCKVVAATKNQVVRI